MDKPSLLVVEDDETLHAEYRRSLRETFSVIFAMSSQQAIKQFSEVRPTLVSLDLGLTCDSTGTEGLTTLSEILAIDGTTKVVAIAVNGERETPYRALQLGAIDCVSRPVDFDELRVVLKRAHYLHELERLGHATVNPVGAARFEDMIGSTPKMREIFTLLGQVAKTDATVLIQGESGTGKELVARAIHARSVRRDGPFVAINCGAIPETLLESELFGSEKGAYTGAHAQRKGKLELAHGGSLFLDEIGEMSLALQVKLLRFLQERRVERVGGRHQIPIDTRVIAASNKDLKAETVAGRFREDVYYRISVVVVTVPPLRERAEDVVLLANAFLRQNSQRNRRSLRFSQRALSAIAAHSWPGNVRELENAVERAVIMTQGRFIEPHDLGLAPAPETEMSSLRAVRNRAERQILVEALMRTQGNISRAARELGVSRPAIHDLLAKHQVPARQFR